MLFSSEGQTKTRTDVMNRISQFRYVNANSLPNCRRPAKFLSLQTMEPLSHYCLSGQQRYTRRPLVDTNDLSSWSPYFIFEAENQSFYISLRYCLVTFLITSLQLSFLYFKLITIYRTHNDLISTVCIKKFNISTWCVNCM